MNRTPTATSGTASDSICPKGWRLPGSSGNGSYFELLESYSNRNGKADNLIQGTTMIQLPTISALRSGEYAINGEISRGYGGKYWSNNSSNKTNSFLLVFYSNYFAPQDALKCGYGFALRCLAR